MTLKDLNPNACSCPLTFESMSDTEVFVTFEEMSSYQARLRQLDDVINTSERAIAHAEKSIDMEDAYGFSYAVSELGFTVEEAGEEAEEKKSFLQKVKTTLGNLKRDFIKLSQNFLAKSKAFIATFRKTSTSHASLLLLLKDDGIVDLSAHEGALKAEYVDKQVKNYFNVLGGANKHFSGMAKLLIANFSQDLTNRMDACEQVIKSNFSTIKNKEDKDLVKFMSIVTTTEAPYAFTLNCFGEHVSYVTTEGTIVKTKVPHVKGDRNQGAFPVKDAIYLMENMLITETNFKATIKRVAEFNTSNVKYINEQAKKTTDTAVIAKLEKFARTSFLEVSHGIIQNVYATTAFVDLVSQLVVATDKQ